MLVKAKANHKPCNDLKPPLTESIVSDEITNEKSNEAAMKPNTNLGKRSQMIPTVGLLSFTVSDWLFVNVQ